MKNQNELERIVYELKTLPKECEWAEFKDSYCTDDDVGEYLSALSNGACYCDQEFGYLVFGLKNETHEIIGTKFHPKQKKVGNEELEAWLARLLNPRVDFRIIDGEIDGKYIAIFKTDAARNIPTEFKKQAFIRIGSCKKKLADYPERARKIWQKTTLATFEKEVAKSLLDADQVLELIDYQSFFESTKQKIPDGNKAILEKLEQEKLISKKNDDFDITNLGALLFAKDISKFDRLLKKAVRVIFYDGINRIKTRKEHIELRGYAAGFNNLINYINDGLPSNEEIGKALRKEVRMYPPITIRELVANMIIHQDFSINGTSPMVEIFIDRIEITNPGKPLVDTLRFIDHAPISRNEMMASFMRRVEICEERGSGIDKVVNACEEFQLPAPNFMVEDGFTRTILYSPRPLREMDKSDKIRACYQHCCLMHVSGRYMTNESLRKRFGIETRNYSTASRIISDTVEAGLVKDYDSNNKSRKYAKYLPLWA